VEMDGKSYYLCNVIILFGTLFILVVLKLETCKFEI
jgi:hypothetical protein